MSHKYLPASKELLAIFEEMFNNVDKQGVYTTIFAFNKIERLINLHKIQSYACGYNKAIDMLNDGGVPRTSDVADSREYILDWIKDFTNQKE